MKSKPVKRLKKETETVTSLKQKNIKLQNKCLSHENKILKLEQIIFKLKSENFLIKTQIPDTDEYREKEIDPELKELVDKILGKSTK